MPVKALLGKSKEASSRWRGGASLYFYPSFCYSTNFFLYFIPFFLYFIPLNVY